MATAQQAAAAQPQARRQGPGAISRFVRTPWINNKYFWLFVSTLVAFGIWNRWSFSLTHAFKEILISIYQMNESADWSTIFSAHAGEIMTMMGILGVVLGLSIWFVVYQVRREQHMKAIRGALFAMSVAIMLIIYAWSKGIIQGEWYDVFLLTVVGILIIGLTGFGAWMVGIAINGLDWGHFATVMIGGLVGMLIFVAAPSMPILADWWFEPSRENISVYVQIVLVLWLTAGFRAKKFELAATGQRTISSSSGGVTIQDFGRDAEQDLHAGHDHHTHDEPFDLGSIGHDHDDQQLLEDGDIVDQQLLDRDDDDDDRR